MARNPGYVSPGELQGVSAEARNSERVADANRNIADLRSEILRLRILVDALTAVVIEKGVDPNLINAKIDEIASKPETFEPARKASAPCPRCGRMVLDNGKLPLTGTCLYCGEVIRFPPRIETEEKSES